MTELKPCPFCGGKAKVSFRQSDFMGRNYYGDRKLKYITQVICNRCHARGKPFKTDYMINPYPWNTIWNGHLDDTVNTTQFRPWVEKAIEAWNRRKEDEHSN